MKRPRMKTYYFIIPEVAVTFTENPEIKKKVLSMTAQCLENQIRVIIPFTEDALPFFKNIVTKFEKWIKEGKVPDMPKPKTKEEIGDNERYVPKYIGWSADTRGEIPLYRFPCDIYGSSYMSYPKS